MQTKQLRLGLVAVLTSLSLVAAACGDDEEPTAASGAAETSETTETTMSEEEEMAPAGSEDDGTMEDSETEGKTGTAMVGGPVGPACGAVPDDGEGSFDGMADDPAATAAGNNPELSTLVTAVTEAGLVDTLNGAGPFTIFAPVNSAFAAIPEADLAAVLADKDLLTSILTLHVVAGEELDAAALSGMDSVATVNGGSLTIEPAGNTLLIGGQASVVCAGIETANATVHLIDAVLMP